MSHTYTMTGPFGHNPETGRTEIRHTSNTQVDIGEYRGSYRNLAGRAILSGIGLVKSISFCDPECLLLPWNMVLTVQHDYHDPVVCYSPLLLS
jgi:hypothetical protein